MGTSPPGTPFFSGREVEPLVSQTAGEAAACKQKNQHRCQTFRCLMPTPLIVCFESPYQSSGTSSGEKSCPGPVAVAS